MHLPGCQVFSDGKQPGRWAQNPEEQSQGSEEIQRSIVTKEDKQQAEDAQTISNGVELRAGSIGALAERDVDLGHGEALVDALDRQLHLELKAARQDRDVLVEAF